MSGYLITGILVRDYFNQRLDLKRFYFRRILRIFPALALVLVASFIFGFFFFFSKDLMSLGKYIAAGALFVSNLPLFTTIGYCDISAENTPLIHLWSLGIEEQFYIFWPCFLFICFRWNINSLFTSLYFIILSFALNIFYVRYDLQGAYFLPWARCWELIIGGLPFLIEKERKSISKISILSLVYKCKDCLNKDQKSFIGILLIIYSIFFIEKGRKVPGWYALIPCIGTYLLILAGPNAKINKLVFSRKLFVFIGLISYPLYLWHWPLLAFVRVGLDIDKIDIGMKFFIIGVSIAFSFFTYKYIERPVRDEKLNSIAPKFLIIIIILIFFLGLTTYKSKGYLWGYAKYAIESKNFDWDFQGTKYCGEKYGRGYSEGHFCMITETTKPATAILIGDSHANHFYPGLKEYLKKSNDILLNIGSGRVRCDFIKRFL
ncbi:acyltransferase family protein [Leptospira santarosai]|uniref:acyltransferase family protein n=1 Tax=Leptospira santarosai TaxID=28183 RepID=UPI0009B77F1B|nr:acyltransferase family protein [Leptospira santarosai]